MKNSLLYRPLKVAGLTLKNRFFSAPTSLAELSPEGHLTRENILYYKLRAAGGCAVVTIGDAIVDGASGRSHPRQILLDDADVIPSLTQAADAIHAHGAAASIELDHGGGLCSPDFVKDKRPRGPSDLTQPEGNPVYGLTVPEIAEMAAAFGRAAETVKRCGFDMLMIHGGHGWLLHQFLSPVTNLRTDEYGGSFENRMRFPLMVVDRIREAVGKGFPIEFRMSADERLPANFGGYGAETGMRIAEALDGKVDLIHVSVGNNIDWESCMLMHPGCFTKHGENSGYAADIHRRVGTPVVSVGAFTDVKRMEAFLDTGGADAIALGRALIADPFLPKKAMCDQEDTITPCLGCGECQGSMWATRTIRCAVNPIIGRESEYFAPPPISEKKKRVLIAGGGPAGLTAAAECAKRGHAVILCDAGDEPGGALFFADGVDFKAGIVSLRAVLVRRARRLGAEIRVGTRVNEAIVREIAPDVLIAAVGSLPIIPPIPGADAPHVIPGAKLRAHSPVGKRAIVIGGGLIGCETALHLAETGHEVVVIEMRDEIAPEATQLHRSGLLWRMRGNGNLQIMTGFRCTAVETGTVRAIDAKGQTRVFEADSVILAAGSRADDETTEALRGLVPAFYAIGDGKRARRILQAIGEGYDAAVDLSLPSV
ncbi:MAG: FAD-dependent oxidoreductase [Clostridiales Family XIII bacterium]|jgi:2,4-dienoyl-CoA reductase-like NADH-dependent reductase (Old Yellow Enzyme family)/thioredoxin reductase|nr:FAD-dependent oxidoreductase [Clostridiales Family XIII bacterium]